MGTCLTVPSQEVEKMIRVELRESKKASNKQIALLVFGCKGSGKKTLLKQIRMIHGDGYSHQQRLSFIAHIHRQIVRMLQTVLSKSNLNAFSMEIQDAVKYVMQTDPLDVLNLDTIECMKAIWYGSRVRELCVSHENHQRLPHFMDSLDRISDIDYVPSDRDILLMDATNHKATELTVNVKGMVYKLISAGEQKSSYQKYIHCFESMRAVIFVASLSCYDVKMTQQDKKLLIYGYVGEDYDVEQIPNDLLDLISLFCDLQDTGNMMKQQMDLFELLINDPFMREMAVILYLNKRDLLAEKLETIPFGEEDSDFHGDGHNFEETVEYIKEKFESLDHHIGHPYPNRGIFIHVTCNMDRENVEKVFNDITHIVQPSCRLGIDNLL